jgi:DNA-binding NarL/FixJ family response regulator
MTTRKRNASMPKTKILLVDDHQVVIEGVKTALAKHADLEIIGESNNARDALKKVESLRPDIVIIDIAMPQFNGIEATYQIKKVDPKVRVIIYTMHSYQEFLRDLIKAGISAYVLKQSPLTNLYTAIQTVKKGGTFFSEDAASFIAKHFEKMADGQQKRDPFDLLSLREREVFQLLAEGHSIKEAADILCLSPKTIETHKYHIMEKLKIGSMTEWTKEAIRRGIVQI